MISTMPLTDFETTQDVYDGLMAGRRGDSVEEILGRILASWTLGIGAMPAWLGLAETAFRQMLAYHFPAIDAAWFSGIGVQTDVQRAGEMDDLHKLLLDNRSGRSGSEGWLVDILIAGCMGNDHLWQDLGLWNRDDLSRLMQENFEPLARLNDKDMKWKKFLYKQLCETEGIYTCRAPSCEVCLDYDKCFGPE
jgi:nitrogen fixation protein NifQ